MVLETVDFYWFSGTGNTLLVVKKMQEVFLAHGIETNLYKMEKTDPRQVNLDHTIGLAFPVAVFSTYPLVWKFIKALPPAHGTRVFMVDTLGGGSAGIVGPLKRVLQAKGYDPFAAKEIIMPSNIWVRKKDEARNAEQIADGLREAEKYAEAIISGKTEWRRIPLLSDMVYFLSQIEYIWKNGGKSFKLDEAKCTKCGLCARICPSGSITMHDYPVRDDTCQMCMRCVSYCPAQAMYYYRKKNPYLTYRAVGVEEFLD